jgi:hypothetical protein
MFEKNSHIDKRNSARGKWLPVVFYLVNLAFWVIGIMQMHVWHLLWLVVFPILPLALYLWRMPRNTG